MTLLKLIKALKLDFTNGILCPLSGNNIGVDFEINPEDFLQFAKSDYREGTQKGLVNSLTNCKRAIDCGIDKILKTYGFDPSALQTNIGIELINKFTRERSNLPYKLRLIEALGITTGKILSDIRITRHKLEHYYKYPTENEVIDAIDLTKMFINLIQAKFYIFEDSYVITDQKNVIGELRFNNQLKIDFYPMKFMFEIGSNLNNDKITYSLPDLEYLILIRLTNSIQDNYDLEDTFKYLLEIINHPLPTKNIKIKRD